MSTAIRLRVFDGSDREPSFPEAGPLEWEFVDCPLCGGSGHYEVLSGQDALTQVGGTFGVVQCVRCQLIFTNPRPTARCLHAFYPADYAPHVERADRTRPPGSVQRRLELALLRQRYGYPPQPGALTEVAATLATCRDPAHSLAGTLGPFSSSRPSARFRLRGGRFLKEARDYGWLADGLDLSPRMVDQLRRGGFEMFLGTLPHPEIAAASYDAITMWHSLEHVPQPLTVLRAAASALRPGGVLAISVPNFASWSCRQFGSDWFGLALPRHLTHFVPWTLFQMVEAAGFRVSSISQVGRDGWIRKSTRRAARQRRLPLRRRLLTSKTCAGLACGGPN